MARSKPDPAEVITRVKKDGQWFFSRYPESELRFRRIDGLWFMLEPKPTGSGGGDVDLGPYAETVYVDQQDGKTLGDAKSYTDTEIGKTVVSALLARALAARGPVRYWKPVQTGDDSDTG